MAEYKLTNGYSLSDEEIEARAKEWEDGTWIGELVKMEPNSIERSNGRDRCDRSDSSPTTP